MKATEQADLKENHSSVRIFLQILNQRGNNSHTWEETTMLVNETNPKDCGHFHSFLCFFQKQNSTNQSRFEHVQELKDHI